MLLADVGLAELHTHLGGWVGVATCMWSLAHEQGIALPVKDYWDSTRWSRVRPARRREPRRPRRDLPLDAS